MELGELRDLISSQNLRWQAADTEHANLPDIQKAARLGAVPPAGARSLSEREQLAASRAAAVPEAALPVAVDWRDMNGADWVTPVEDQGSCGSRVAFGTVAAFESHVLIARANPKFSVDLSEADLWFCYGPAHGAGQ
jgi:C1A family cysteine protease